MKFYVDTSVWGGHEDAEFEEWTIPFFEQARIGKFTLVLSDLTLRELAYAPASVRQLTETIPDPFLELVSLTTEAEKLANHYIKEGVLTLKFESDAQHIAMSTILKVDGLISWNFKHMVNFFRIKQYNAINLKFGYQTIDIRTPKEVIYANED
ncbi:MAG: PIN domain protein [Sphingobacteriaceae bacterium]|nr:MAG: PIN domain protein [Sphingobacteriaceae bacterium]